MDFDTIDQLLMRVFALFRYWLKCELNEMVQDGLQENL